MKNSLVLIILIMTMSCKETQQVGKWNDNIKLSERKVEVSGEANAVIITTQGRWWWLSELLLNGEYVDFGTVDTSVSDFMIKKEDFSIVRKNTTQLEILLTKNTSSEKRELHIGLQAGNYFDSIEITQLPQPEK